MILLLATNTPVLVVRRIRFVFPHLQPDLSEHLKSHFILRCQSLLCSKIEWIICCFLLPSLSFSCLPHYTSSVQAEYSVSESFGFNSIAYSRGSLTETHILTHHTQVSHRLDLLEADPHIALASSTLQITTYIHY